MMRCIMHAARVLLVLLVLLVFCARAWPKLAVSLVVYACAGVALTAADTHRENTPAETDLQD